MKPVVSHWVMQRLTAIGLVPLSLWFIFIALPSLGGSYDQARAFLQTYSGSIPAFLFTLGILYHGLLGLQVVVEDYLALPQRTWTLWALTGVFWGSVIVSGGSLLIIFLQG